MTWVKLDDGFSSHPKTLAAGCEAVALLIASLCWSSRNLTDGVIPKHVLPLLLGETGVKKAAAKRLVEVGYWHEQGEHWEINGYLERNPSRAQVEKNRARWRRYKLSTGDSTAEPNVESNGDLRGRSTADSTPSRSRTRKYLHTPTTESRCEPTGRAEEARKILLAIEREHGGHIRNQDAWNRTVGERIAAEYGPRIDELCETFPTAPPDVIAGAALGDTSNLRYYTDTQP